MLLKEEKEKLFVAGEEGDLVGISGRDSGESSWYLLMIFVEHFPESLCSHDWLHIVCILLLGNALPKCHQRWQGILAHVIIC